MRFSVLARRLESLARPVPAGAADPELLRARLDSRRVGPGDLFCALPGTRADGRAFLEEALGRGAAAVLTPPPAPELAVPVLMVRPEIPPARAAGEAAAALAGDPGQGLFVTAVTGTNGKTTVVHLLAAALESAGIPAARAGTLGLAFGGRVEEGGGLTTPPADLLQDWLARCGERGARALVLEASSHALDQERLAGLPVDAAAWTNLSRDHLDYHGDLAAYARAKARLIHALEEGSPALVPAGDERIEAVCAGAPARRLPFGLDDPAAALRGRAVFEAQGLRLQIDGELGEAEIASPLIGRHNAENLLVAWGLARCAGLGAGEAAGALGAAPPPPGRLERVAPDFHALLFVDYAHTPEALERALAALREAFPGRRLGVVFGAGGDRDRGKRPRMGEAAARGADWCLVTSDNPRSEDPAAIAEEVAAGVRGAGLEAEVVLDRREAIRSAVGRLGDGEVLLVAGKGHESWQEIQGLRSPFDDREELREAVRCRT